MLDIKSMRATTETNLIQNKSSYLGKPPPYLMAAPNRHGKISQDDICYVVAKYDYTAQGTQELDLRKNERCILLDDSKHWWRVQNSRNQSGYVPSNYVKKEKPSLFDSIKKKVSVSV
ncbi:SH3 domain-containing protein, partial [Oryctes borbonicus]